LPTALVPWLAPAEQFATQDLDVLWGANAQADAITAHVQKKDLDGSADHDGLVWLSG
jgi:hypothetical protein